MKIGDQDRDDQRNKDVILWTSELQNVTKKRVIVIENMNIVQ